MYTEGAQTTGHRRFLQDHGSKAPVHCPCQHCARREPPLDRHGGPERQPAPARRPDRRSDCRRDVQAPWAKDAGGGASESHRSPQRRPVFAWPGPHLDRLDPVYPWELIPAQWKHPAEPGPHHCACVARPCNAGIPHPLPHLQVKGQDHRLRRTVRYVSVEEERHSDHHGPPPGPWLALNGHCEPKGGQERDKHHDRGRPRAGSQEAFNGCAAPRNGFFPTEVPQNHLSQSRRTAAPPDAGSEPRPPGPELPKRTKQDSVREQIRQVVTDLEDVLGGLKQVHSEMKEVVEQIDRLTATIDLGEDTPSSARLGESRSAPPPNHRPAPSEDRDRIILRTNAPSPVHMAAVVKTRGFTPLSLSHDRPGANGHPPHLHALRDSAPTGPEPRPHTLDPQVIVGNSTSNPRTQKPPPYPQNGRCVKGAVRTPASAGRGRVV
ncbi:uncharacterized protein LOC115405515 [Salarias fasciatus]|uniref:uncharacterized protein LOC115405515 n=1 Tax=Salarias fasciatus TaxID=181472 RepID=UPI001176BB69|nr:uncharacterized protein LOC115405515 [Salarias fasciatus]